MKLRDIQHIRYNRWIFSVNDNFLCAQPELNSAINYCIQVSENTSGALQEFYTLLIDLQKDLVQIKEGIHHRTLSEINSFLNNQNYEHKVIYDLSASELRYYIKLFNQFAKIKKIRKAEAYRLEAYNSEKILAVSFIKRDNKPLCINFYRVTKQRATNLHSFSIQQDLSASQSGRAHRALHWLDILEFKNMGVSYYDFGGWYPGQSDRSLLNINRFKENFTTHKVKEYSGVIYKKPILILLKKLFS
ncbi:MAG: hypothetical protein JNL60_06735 [Bacteroidia bacterium]|nr:hypothetical protein [Bacteroidia bacterium]